MYCPRCQDVFFPLKAKHDNIDGAYFGPYFAHMFVVNYPLLFVKPKQNFVGTLCGFRMHSSSENHPVKIEYSTQISGMRVVPRPAAHFADPAGRPPARELIVYVKPHS